MYRFSPHKSKPALSDRQGWGLPSRRGNPIEACWTWPSRISISTVLTWNILESQLDVMFVSCMVYNVLPQTIINLILIQAASFCLVHGSATIAGSATIQSRVIVDNFLRHILDKSVVLLVSFWQGFGVFLPARFAVWNRAAVPQFTVRFLTGQHCKNHALSIKMFSQINAPGRSQKYRYMGQGCQFCSIYVHVYMGSIECGHTMHAVQLSTL